MQLFLAPGDMVCNIAGLAENSEHRQILRMFTNTLLWGLVAAIVAFRWAL